jgi:cation transport ATPase
MPPTTSAKVFLVEFVVIVVPYGLAIAAGMALLFMLAIASSFKMEAVLILVASTVLAVPYIAGATLSIAFLRGGASKLRSAKHLLWVFASLGASVAAIAILGAVIGYRIPWPFPPWSPAENPFGLAPRTIGQAFERGLVLAPLLLPFGHLLWERSKAYSNSSLEQSRDA